jgi:hypothetical protein
MMEGMKSGTTPRATREDLHVLREWLRHADRESEPSAGRIMRPGERECLRRVLDAITVQEVQNDA